MTGPSPNEATRDPQTLLDEAVEVACEAGIPDSLVRALVYAAAAVERARVKQLLTLPTLKAIRAIPDGEIRNGCVVVDGGQVRKALRQAYLAIDAPPAEGCGRTSADERSDA